MPKAARCRFSSSHGFTLIELMVVISIIAILATVGLVTYTHVEVSSRDGKRLADLQEIQKALEQYYAVKNSYYIPSGGDSSGGVVTIKPSDNFSSLNSYFSSNAAPTDPAYGTTDLGYHYAWCTTSYKNYILCAKLENCGTTCQRSAIPGNSCSGNGDINNGGNVWYCIASISSN